jgi:tetratricopeptide (TPR) repeat protein
MTRRLRALSFLALAAPAFVLSAQQPAKPGAPAAAAAAAAAPQADPCPIELMQPTGLGIANLQRSKLANVKTVDDGNKVMRDVTKLLFDPKQATNPMGRDLLLGEFVTFYITLADSAKRGDIGFPGDKTQYVDLLKVADSLFTLIENGEPKCKLTTLGWRNYKPYTDRIKAAYAAVGANALDTASKLAQRAMILNHSGPQPYDVLWRVAKAKNDEANAIMYLQLAADKLEGDTLNSVVRSNFLFTLGRLQQEYGDAKTDKAQKDKLYRDAAKPYLQVLKEFPTGDEAPFAMQGISISAAITGDTSLSNAAVAVIKATPEKFTDQTVAQAGVLSTAAGKTADAVMFFGIAAKMNPYFRDYLYNLAAMMYEAKQTTDMIPVVHKLVDIDPNNPDDLMLFTYGFSGVQNATKDPAIKKAAIDSVMYFGKLAEAMPARVSFSDFERQQNRTVLVGSVENRTKEAKSYSIDFEFIGKDGTVLQKSTATVASVAPGASGSFKIDFPIGGVFGYRYGPLK